MRRLVILSALLILGGLVLLLPSSPLYSIVSSGSATSAAFSGIGTTDDTTTIESLLGFGLIGAGLVLEVLSMFTEVGAGAPSASSSSLHITPAITPEIMILAILLAVAVGTFGGLIPAWRASRMNPVEALRRS